MFYEAIFQPSENVNYNDEAEKLSGKKIPIQGGSKMEKGPFKGQLCYYIPKSTVGFLPASDLKELKPIPYVQWDNLHKGLGF